MFLKKLVPFQSIRHLLQNTFAIFVEAFAQSTLVISNFISNNRLSRSENLVPVP